MENDNGPGWSQEAWHATILIEFYCNLKCQFCFYHGERSERPRTYMKFRIGDFIPLLDRLKASGLRHAHLCGIGEPFLNPDIFHIIDYAVENIDFVSLQSNFCNPVINKPENIERFARSGVGILHTNWDSADPEEFEFLRRGLDYQQFVTNCRYLFEMVAKHDTGMNATARHIIMKSNYRGMKKFLREAYDVGFRRIDLSNLVPNTSEDCVSGPNNVVTAEDHDIIKFVRESIAYGRDLGLEIRSLPLYDGEGEDDKNRKCLTCIALGNYGAINMPCEWLPEEEWYGNVIPFCGLSVTRYGYSLGNVMREDYRDFPDWPKVLDLKRRLERGEDVPGFCMWQCPNYNNPDATVDPDYKEKLPDWPVF